MKFFNKKRFLLFRGTRFQKYITYALGEIILVVCGILIALAINNWRQTKADDRELERIISVVKADLKNDLKETKVIIDSSTASYKLTAKILLDDNFKDSLRDCYDCRYIINEAIPVNLHRKGYNLLVGFNKDSKNNSAIKDSLLAFYSLYKLEDFKLLNDLVVDEVIDNFKYMRDHFDWFSNYQLQGVCEEDCLDYFSSQTYINRLTYFDLMANDNYLLAISHYRGELKKVLNYLDSNETIP
ncbi:DUF6090 family protein [Psychroserpens sp. Hel_I_66]|uniref:DUF6090 family protein n=1 Tax=Psychroserpens sp. Hel_I_66 TaxID=1250004 RepID=UPI00068BE98E|nr:DUF6090 family protein [Psychroserpens sp. Hel_I_66]